jgi:hypothetical protein
LEAALQVQSPQGSVQRGFKPFSSEIQDRETNLAQNSIFNFEKLIGKNSPRKIAKMIVQVDMLLQTQNLGEK